MTDIVERLRAVVKDAEAFDGSVLKEWDKVRANVLTNSSDHPRMMFECNILAPLLEHIGEAADEIEGLRAEIVRLRNELGAALVRENNLKEDYANRCQGYSEASDAVEKADDEIEQLREALQRIVQWSDAYPIDIFHEPTTEEYKCAHGALKVVGLTMDAFSASMGRHCLEGVKKIANEALLP